MSRIRGALLLLLFCLFCAPPAGAQSVGSLFTTLPADFRHLFTVANGIVIGVGGAASAAVYPKDDDIAAWIESTNGVGKDAFSAGHVIGSHAVQGGIALGAYIIGRASHSPRLGEFGADLVDAQIVNAVLTTGLKLAVNRERPSGSGYSFPSGHTSATFATAAVIQTHYGWKVAAPFYVLGGYVGVSRMVDGHHFASDVIFGAALGLVAGRAASFGHGLHRVSITPAALPGGIMFVGSIGE